MDDALLDVVLVRLDAEPLAERPKNLLLAALDGDSALADAVGGKVRPSPSAPRELARPDIPGSYLSRLAVSGFRGIGPAVELRFPRGPGLTLVVGRNGSGKSSFAEALEFLVTGHVRRWDDRAAIWRAGWRNLHSTDDPFIEVDLLVEGSKPVTLRRSWDTQDELDHGTTVLLESTGEERGLENLGWTGVLDLHRPFLAYSELESMLGKPSELYDLLVAVLGLDDLTQAIERLAAYKRDTESKLKQVREDLLPILQDLGALDDERAHCVIEALPSDQPDQWNLDSAAAVATGVQAVTPGGEIETLRSLIAITPPDEGDVTVLRDKLRAAADGLDKVAGTQAERASRLADLLKTALDHHHEIGDGPCPVCGQANALNAAWRSTTEAEIARLRSEATAADRASEAAKEARGMANRLLYPPPAVLDQSVEGLDSATLRAAWVAWSQLPSGEGAEGLRAIDRHIEEQMPKLKSAYDALREQAKVLLSDREDRWSPLASRVATWCEEAKSVFTAPSLLQDLRAAENWLKDAIDDLRNQRLEPLAKRSTEIWAMLRQESNVDLGGIKLKGARTRREVDFRVTVDGEASSALGVMSQGEVNALALSVFLPRAALPQSPFRFLVIDDPVQAMDPAKVEGLARVLSETARERQVIVFTHDDRLSEAVRRLRLCAHVLEVTRRPQSVVEVREGLDPTARAIDDARALMKDRNVPDDAARRVVAGLCRIAVEAAFVEIIRSRRLGRGDTHAEVENALTNAYTLNKKAALALFDDANKVREVPNELSRKCSRDLADIYRALNKGSHGSYEGDLDALITHTEELVDQLRQKIR